MYAVGHANLQLAGLFLAAVKACGRGAALSHYSGAALWGFGGWDGRYPEVTFIGPATCAHPGLRIHRTTTLDLAVTSSGHQGIPLTSPARTLPNLAATLGDRPARSGDGAERSRCNA